jgi:DNA-binding CsgD family transcriptional regulator
MGKEPLVITPEIQSVQFTEEELSILKDENHSYTIEEISSNAFIEKFQPVEGLVGLSNAAYWLRLQMVLPPGGDEDWILEVEYPQAEHVVLYLPLLQGGYEKKSSGIAEYFYTREIKGNTPAFYLSGPRKEINTYYLKIESPYIKFPLHLYSAEAFYVKKQNNTIFFSIIYGILIIVMIINALLYFNTNDRVHAYFGFFLLSFTLFISCENGFVYQFLWQDAPEWNKRFECIFICMLLLATQVFCYSVTRLRNKNPQLYKTGKWIAAVPAVFAFVSMILPNVLVMPLTLLFMLLNSVWCLGIGIYMVKEKNKATMNYVLGSAVFMFFILFTFIDLLNRKNSVGINYMIIFSGVLQTLFYSFALGIRVKENIENNARTLNSLKTQEEFLVVNASSVEQTVKELPSELTLLSKREREVLEWISQGLSDKEVAEKMNLSLPTIKTHSGNVYSKLNVKNRMEATLRYKQFLS